MLEPELLVGDGRAEVDLAAGSGDAVGREIVDAGLPDTEPGLVGVVATVAVERVDATSNVVTCGQRNHTRS
jgi:hypothetical protein